MKAGAARMEAAVAFVSAHPGATSVAVTFHVLEGMAQRERPTAYKQAASVVERIIKDRHVRQDGLQLFPWDVRRKAYAEALERAAFAAPDAARFAVTMELAMAAWKDAGDDNRARILSAMTFTERSS